MKYTILFFFTFLHSQNYDFATSQFDLDFINTTKKNTEFTYQTRYNYLFENDAVFLGVLKGEYFQQEADGVKQDLENKGMLHLRYTHPIKSFFVEGFIQNEFSFNRNFFSFSKYLHK